MNNFWENLFSNQYAKAVFIVLISFLISKIITYLSNKYFKKWSEKSKTELDDLIIEKLKPPFTYLIVIFGLHVAIGQIESNALWLERVVSSILAIALIYSATIIVDIAIRFWVEFINRKKENKMADSLIPLFKKTTIVIMSILALIWVLNIWGVDITPFLASLGIAGFVVGFAMQDSLKNIFGGIALILDQTMQVGDKISLEGGELGIVNVITIRSTKIKTFDNEIITVPNGRLSEMKIKNFTQPNDKLRVIANFSTAYGSNTNKVKEIVVDVIKKMEGIKEEPEADAIMIKMADSGLEWQARFWVDDQSTAFDKKLEALDIIYKALNENNIEIPFPTSTVHLKKEEE
jgi:MscS family membrane protein